MKSTCANGRYRLTDLENNHVYDEFDASNLRPYHARVDAEDLEADEYIVDHLLKHRDRRGAREYFVKSLSASMRSAEGGQGGSCEAFMEGTIVLGSEPACIECTSLRV